MQFKEFLKEMNFTEVDLERAELQPLLVQNPELTLVKTYRKHSLALILKIDRLISAEECIVAEDFITNVLACRNVVLSLRPQDLNSETPAAYFPWLEKHLKERSRLEYRMLKKGRVKAEIADRLAYILPQDSYEYFRGQGGEDSLSTFWSNYAPFDVPVYFLLDSKDESESKLQRERVEVFAKEAKLWSEKLLARKERALELSQEQSEAVEPLPQGAGNSGPPATVTADLKNLRFGQLKGWPMQSISELTRDGGSFRLLVTAHNVELKTTKNNSYLVTAELRDKTGGIAACNFFRKEENALKFAESLDGPLIVEVKVKYDDRYEEDIACQIAAISVGPDFRSREYSGDLRRVELHAKTNLSSKEAITKAKELLSQAVKLKLSGLAITDRDVVQAFPEVAAEARKIDEKVRPQIIYGLELEVIDDGSTIVYSLEDLSQFDLSEGFIALDLETTGLDPNKDRIIEVGAILYEPMANSREFTAKAEWSGLFNPGFSIPEEITELTGITEFDLLGKPAIEAQIEELREFIGERPILGHNILFDIAFLRNAGYLGRGDKPPVRFNQPLIDTLPYARAVLPNERRHGLAFVAKALNIKQESHHRAVDDARVAAEIFIKLWSKETISTLGSLNHRYGQLKAAEYEKQESYLITLLACNQLGLYSLYRLVSEAHLNYYQDRPLVPISVLNFLKSGLLISSHVTGGAAIKWLSEILKSHAGDLEACERILNEDFIWRRRFRDYDYLEFQPPKNYMYLTKDPNTPLRSFNDLKNLCRLQVQMAKLLKKPLVAVSNAHYANPDDWEYRAVLLHDKKEPVPDSESYYLRDPQELLEEFEFLEDARSYVIDNPAKIRAACDPKLMPVPDGSFPPLIEAAEEELKAICEASLNKLYRQADGNLPELVEKRYLKELDAIISNGYAVMYYIAHHLVKKSNEDGFVVGSRGSVGSSFIATLMNITEVNPLAPHYRCPKCNYFEANENGLYGSGYDLPEANCPHCQTAFEREGQDIPFETFLGFSGNKQPDIDLNFSGLYQSEAHKFIEEMFGREFSFRAGTISGYAEKNSRLIARNYLRDNARRSSRVEINRLAEKVQGVKVTTGQHPGGIIVIPKDREIYDFTPIQHPANKASDIITTHLDFNALHETILKLDILGHDDPTCLKLCQELTGVEIKSIPVPDPKVMSLFKSTEALGIKEGTTDIAATIGLPEVGTMMAREMAETCHPERFYDLVQLSGLAHGTDVWAGNARELIVDGVCTLNEVIGCRDSIMTKLIYDGIDSLEAFKIMESVRKGRGLTVEQEELLRANPHVPDWYIDSCKKIKYMFPKAHAVAYTISALRIAWFKVYHPVAYYAATFSIRLGEFSADRLLQDKEVIQKERLERRDNFYRLDELEPQGKKKFYLLELVEEMHNRGLEFAPISLEDSGAWRFGVSDDGRIIPPFSTIPGISVAMGQNIVNARAEGPFKNQEEFKERCGLGQVAMEQLASFKILDGLPASAQVDFFGLI